MSKGVCVCVGGGGGGRGEEGGGPNLKKKEVTDVSTTCAVVIFRVKVSCITSVDGLILWLLI